MNCERPKAEPRRTIHGAVLPQVCLKSTVEAWAVFSVCVNGLVRHPSMDSTNRSRLLLPIRPLVDHAHGPEDAPYTLVEYGDYECPDCGRLYVILRDLQRDSDSRLRIVFRHYPLSGVHRHAQQAAEAAEAAGAQGKFWEMHTLLFERQVRSQGHRRQFRQECSLSRCSGNERRAPRPDLSRLRGGIFLLATLRFRSA